jgi:hypothetical protein
VVIGKEKRDHVVFLLGGPERAFLVITSSVARIGSSPGEDGSAAGSMVDAPRFDRGPERQDNTLSGRRVAPLHVGLGASRRSCHRKQF